MLCQAVEAMRKRHQLHQVVEFIVKMQRKKGSQDVRWNSRDSRRQSASCPGAGSTQPRDTAPPRRCQQAPVDPTRSVLCCSGSAPFPYFYCFFPPFIPCLFPTVLFSPYVNTEWSQREAEAACGARRLRLATPQAQGQTLDWLPMGGLLRVAVSHCQAPAGLLGANRRGDVEESIRRGLGPAGTLRTCQDRW